MEGGGAILRGAISIFAVFKPAFKIGKGHFIKKPEAYSSQRRKDQILAKNRTWFQKNQDKLQVCIFYEQPGNREIFRFPNQKEERGKFILWLKFKPAFSIYPVKQDGTLKVEKSFVKGDREARTKAWIELMDRFYAEKEGEKLWLARIYEHPGNCMIWDWSEEGEKELG